MAVKCTENFSDIVAVWPILRGRVDYAIPFNVRRRTYSLADLGVTDIAELKNSAPCLSISPDFDGDDCIEIEERACSVKSASQTSVAGRSYDVTLSLKISEKSAESANIADDLSAEAHDFLILVADGTYIILRNADNGYKCSVTETFAAQYELAITVTMETYNGLVRIE